MCGIRKDKESHLLVYFATQGLHSGIDISILKEPRYFHIAVEYDTNLHKLENSVQH